MKRLISIPGKRKHCPGILPILLLLVFLPLSLLADTVLLRDGTQINGRIIQQNQASIVIVSGNRRRVIQKSGIARILYNNNYGDDAEDERRKQEEERQKRLEEQRKREEAERQKRIEEERRKRLEEQRRQEEKRQQEILNQIEEEQKEQQTREETERKAREEEERKAREEAERREQERRNQQNQIEQTSWTDGLLRTIIGEEVNRHEIRFRLDGGGGRVRPAFVPYAEQFNGLRGLQSNKSITSSPASYLDGASYGGEIEYFYDRFMVRLSSRRLESAYSRATYEMGTTTDDLTGLPTDSFFLDLDYARDLSRVEHSFALGFTVYSNEFLEVRPVAEYIGQFTRSNNDRTSFNFQTSALDSINFGSTSNRMWLRGVRGSLEVLYDFQLLGQNFQWKVRAGAVQLQGSAISDSRANVFNVTGIYQGQQTFKVDPEIFYEGTSLESTLYYQVFPGWRVYIGLAGQTGLANVSNSNVAQNFGGFDPLQTYFLLQDFNQNLKLGGLRDHHARISFGAEYLLDLQ
ncbi:MAG: hypothetical protein CMN76_06270 [Spirochaetaceae bacterium]|nr:hypothetical protein [Spirochaetaceae bacterium]|tara:strand:- start:22974 stop:24533 length:1560 start_codon:yes stop_codon:yes gene_type:complete